MVSSTMNETGDHQDKCRIFPPHIQNLGISFQSMKVQEGLFWKRHETSDGHKKDGGTGHCTARGLSPAKKTAVCDVATDLWQAHINTGQQKLDYRNP